MADPHHAYRPTRWRGYYRAQITQKRLYTPDGEYAVQVLTVERETRAQGSGKKPIPWDVLQTIKNDVLGPDAYCIEVYPPQGRIVAETYRRHLWEIPPDLLGYFPDMFRGYR